MIIKENYSLLPHNTFGIDVKCRKFIEYDCVSELTEVLAEIVGNNERYLHIGEGSNLLFTKDFDGIILHSAIKGRTLIAETSSYVLLRVGAGENWDSTVEWCIANGLYGAENLSLIPGEVGAAAVQNIGAYGVEIEQIIHEVETLEVATGEKKIFTHDEMSYAYRESILKGSLKSSYIVTNVVFKLNREYFPNITYRALQSELIRRNLPQPSAEELRRVIIEIRRSKLPDPKELGSAGSFFMNPVIPKEKAMSLLDKYPEMPCYAAQDGMKIPAGWLIEQCGWKGKTTGSVGVYPKQALVLVNYGG